MLEQCQAYISQLMTVNLVLMQVYVDELVDEDYLSICSTLFPSVERSLLLKLVLFNKKLYQETMVHHKFGQDGSPWEFNLHDVILPNYWRFLLFFINLDLLFDILLLNIHWIFQMHLGSQNSTVSRAPFTFKEYAHRLIG